MIKLNLENFACKFIHIKNYSNFNFFFFQLISSPLNRCHPFPQLLEVCSRSHVGRLSVLDQRRPPQDPHRHDDHHVQEDLRWFGKPMEVSYKCKTFHGFVQNKFAYGGSALRLSQFIILLQLPLKWHLI